MVRSMSVGRVLLVLSGLLCAAPAPAQVPVETLHTFGERISPEAPLIQATNGHLYGTTRYGGVLNRGTIFRTTLSGSTTVVYTFAGGFDGGYPTGALVQTRDGNLYGTTSSNGAYNQGILFRFSLDGHFTILHAFNAALDASEPVGGLIEAPDGYLYGTSRAGGSFSRGTVFRTTLAGNITVQHSFAGGTDDGAYPWAPLIQGIDVNFYGTTLSGGGGSETGTAFRMTPGGAVTLLHRFRYSDPGGSYPERTLVQELDGNFYGSTSYPNPSTFRLTASGLFTVLVRLPETECSDCGTIASLTRGAGGIVYATSSAGNVYAIDMTGVVTLLHSSVRSRNALVQASDGYLYGTTDRTVFRLTPVPGAPATVVVSSPLGPTVRVAWTPVAGAASYTVKRRLLGGGEIVVATGLQTTSLVDAAVQKGRRYSYVVTAVNGYGEGVRSYEVSVTPGRAVAGDFDGDGRADAAVFRPSNGTWYWIASGTGTPTASQWGAALDVPVAGDYDGDALVDTAVFRPSTGTWYVRSVGSGVAVGAQWGNADDVPVPGDYDGDGKTDFAVFRPSNGMWYVRYSATGATAGFQWGNGNDTPVPGDYDGDGKTDLAVFRRSDGVWYVWYSATGATAGFQMNKGSDVPVPADYDGDGKTDFAMFLVSCGGLCNGVWSVVFSSNGATAYLQWGARDDTPTPADFDGDGRADLAVFRPANGTWYWYSFAGATGGAQWGASSDRPILER